VQLFADRFVIPGTVEREQCAIDLSTGARVTLLTSSAGGASDQIQWSLRCDRFFRLHHRSIARLVDYGLAGHAMRFEAWRCGEAWRGSRRTAAGALAQVTTFLHAIGVPDGHLSVSDVRTDAGRPVVLPRSKTGYDSGGTTFAIDDDLTSRGITTIERSSIDAVAEMLASANGPIPRAIALGAVAGAGASVAIHQLSRIARLQGLVPVAVSARATECRTLLDGRTLWLIDHHGGHSAWSSLIERLLVTAKPHMLLSVGAHRLTAAARLQLERVSEERLIRAVIPPVHSASLQRAIERAARRAEGLPARFAALLWETVGSAGGNLQASTIAAERPPVYGDTSVVTQRASPSGIRIWPAPTDLAALRTRLTDVLTLIERGRHAPGERGLRAVIGSLARRHDWHYAARGQLALAAALLGRGRSREALEALADARDGAVRGGEEAILLEAGIVAGHAHLDEGRLDEAETILRGSASAARGLGDPALAAVAATALVRCLFWRGRYADADAALHPFGTVADSAAAVGLDCARARVAIGAGDLGAAISFASSARTRAERHGRPQAVARAHYAMAFAHLAAGDLHGVERDVAMCITAARAARDPLRAIKARLIAAEASRRAGSQGAVQRHLQLVTRAGRAALPATVRARLVLLADLPNGIANAVRKQVASTGLHGLALFAPSEVHQRAFSAYDAAIDILNLCQTGDEDVAVLGEICRRVRQRVGAIAVAIFAREGQTLARLAADGHTIEPAIAERTMDIRQAIPPGQYHERLEGGVPIRVAGETLGALTARWTLVSPPEPARVEMVLTMAAAAAATAVAAAIARRRSAVAAGIVDILGVSPAIADVREAVERAAAAPFTVLVEGESGSGKELVARALHRRSVRRDRPFTAINCAALPDDLIDAELFGHSRGAFTGALSERMGVFEESHLGTLFFDEVGELSARGQAKVLRTLQDGEVRRVGENLPRRVDVRLVAATNRDLRQEVAAGRFRLDLMYRLDVIRITIPPLRDRRDDIPLLAEHFWHAAARRVGSRAVLSAQTVGALARYDWPGNVRELQNVLASLAVRAPRRGVIPPTALPPGLGATTAVAGLRLGDARRCFEERFIRAALARTGGHRGRAAQELGLSRQGLAKLMSRLQISG
jgi:DNA-binding NtrC family response regulator